MTMRWFGKKREAPIYNSCPEAPTPIYSECLHCTEKIAAEDDGFYDAGNSVFHRACFLRMLIGSISHQQGKCSCFDSTTDQTYIGSDDKPAPEITVRQEAEAAVAYFERDNKDAI